MNTVAVTEEHLVYWRGVESLCQVRPITMHPPDGSTGCEACEAVVTEVAGGELDGTVVVRVPWKPAAEDLVHLIEGGTLWLSTWGGLPPHSIEVQAPGFEGRT